MHPTTHAEVAVLVLNWNGRSLLETFLPSWVQHTPAGADLIIVDNGSTDDSVAFVREHYPEVRLHLFTGEPRLRSGLQQGHRRAGLQDGRPAQ